MAGNTVRIGTQVTGVGKASSDLDRLRDKFDRLQKQGAKGFMIGAGAAVTTAALGLLSTAAGKVIDVLGDSVRAAVEEEKSVALLGAALRANIPAWDGNTAAIEKVLTARMALGFADDEQRESLKLLVAATHDASKALAIQRIAMDLARFKGIDLATATLALVRVESGQFTGLKRLGIAIEENATVTEALAAVQKVASGQAETYARTNAGKLEVSQVKVGEAMEKLGMVIMPVLVDVLGEAADAATGLATVFDVLSGKARLTSDEGRALIDFVAGLPGPIGTAATAMRGLGDETGLLNEELSDSARAAERGAEIWDRHMVPALQDVGFEAQETGAELRDTAKDATWAAEKVGSVWEELVPRFAGVKTRLTALANEAVSAIYDPMIRASELAANAREQAEQRVIIAQKRATDESKADYTDRVEDAKLRLLELEKAALAMQIEMVGAGEANAATITTLTDKLQTAIETGSDEEVARLRALLGWLETLRAAAGKTADALSHIGTGFSRTTVTARQHGGPVAAHEPVIVGEKQAELFVPRSAGTIIPRLPSAGAGRSVGGSLSLTVNVTPAFGMTPAAARALGDAVGPAIYDYLFRRGAMART